MKLSLKSYILFIVWQVSQFYPNSGLQAQSVHPGNQQVNSLLLQAARPGNSYDSSILLLSDALQLSKKNNYKRGEALVYDRFAELMLESGRLNETAKYDSLIAVLLPAVKDSQLFVNHYNRLGVYSMEKGKNSDAEKYFAAALSSGLEKEATGKTAEVHSNIGSLHLAKGNKEKAMEEFFLALRLYEKNNKDAGVAETFSNISSVYYLMGKTDDAIAYQENSIDIRDRIGDKNGTVISSTNIGQLYLLKGNKEKALQYFEKAVKAAEQTSRPKSKGIAYSAMSVYNVRNGNFEEALKWQTKAIVIFEELDDKPLLSRMYVAAGGHANAIKDSAKAINYFKKGLALSTELGNKENIANANEKLSTFYLLHSDYKQAYDYYKNYIKYRDSITEKSSVAKLEAIRSQFETEKKDNEIKKLNTLQQLKQLEIDKQNAILAGNLLEAKQKQNAIELLLKEKELQGFRIIEQEKELETQSLLAKNKEQQFQLAEKERQLQKRLLNNQRVVKNFLLAGFGLLLLMGFILFNRFKLKRKVQQQEALLAVRNSISKDLHDDIGASLSNIGILNEMASRSMSDSEKAKDYLSKASEDIQRISGALSDIVWNVNPRFDNPDDIFIRMRRYAADMLEGAGINATIILPEKIDSINMTMQQRRDFYLIFKEAVNNLAKYSGATNASVEVLTQKGNISLLVKDDGNGFDLSKVATGNGLNNMQQRAKAHDGKISIDSVKGKGTSIFLVMPLE